MHLFVEGSSHKPPPDLGECGETPSGKFILGTLNCDYVSEGPIGGTNTGNAGDKRVRLVH